MDLEALVRATKAIRRGPEALDAVLDFLAVASPRTELFACVYRTHPALELGLCAGIRDGKRLDLGGLPEAFARSPTFFDRWSVEAEQRDRWQEYPDANGAPALRQYWSKAHAHRSHRFRRIVLCQGSRPLAYVSAHLPSGEPWAPAELAAIKARFRAISSTLRLTALAWRDRHSPEDSSTRLLAESQEALVLGTEGELLAASPAARRWLATDAELATLVDGYGRGSPNRSYRLEHFRLRTGVLEGQRSARWQVLQCAQARELPAPTRSPQASSLSVRERELTEWLVLGLTNAEIADRMGCRPSTVKTMLERMYEKFEVRGRVQLTQLLGSRS
jgi:DNA-binding CsgD family transcriptional regulator